MSLLLTFYLYYWHCVLSLSSLSLSVLSLSLSPSRAVCLSPYSSLNSIYLICIQVKNYNVIYGTILRNLRDQGCFEGGSGISVVDEAGNESIIHVRMVRKVRTHSECFIRIILYLCYNYSLLAVIHIIHMYTYTADWRHNGITFGYVLQKCGFHHWSMPLV